MSSSPPRVAVVMATYNGAAYLTEQVESILGQRNVEVSLFFRDDGSTDGTLEMVESLCRSNPGRVQVIRDGRGPQRSPGRNFLLGLQALDLESFDYVCLSDQDDLWLPDKIGAAVQSLSREGADGYSSNLTIWDGRTGTGLLRKNPHQTRYDYLFQTASAGCTYVLSRRGAREVVRHTRPLVDRFDRSTAHDLIIYAVIRSGGLGWVHDERSFILYRQHGNNVYGANTSSTKLLRMLGMVRSNWYGTIIEDALLASGSRVGFVDDMFSRSLTRRLRSLAALGQTRREPLARVLLGLFVLLGLLKRRDAS